MAGHCPACGVVLPLSGEPNCYCEPRKATGTARTAPLSDPGPILALVDPPSPDSAPEPLR